MQSSQQLDSLLRAIVDHIPVVLTPHDPQAERIDQLVTFGPEAVRPIEEAVLAVGRDGDHFAQFVAAAKLCGAIARIGGPDAFDALAAIASSGSDAAEYREVREAAVRGLGELGDERAIELLERVRERYGLHDAAAAALEQLGDAPQEHAKEASLSPLEQARAGLERLSIVDESAAVAELESHNAARRTVWGDRAAVIPIARGPAATAFAALEACLAADRAQRGARKVVLEEVRESGASPELQARLATLPPRQREKFLKKAAAHAAAGAGEGRVRKLILTAYFDRSFGKHEILRVGEDDYVAMPCNLAVESTSSPVRIDAAPRAAAAPEPRRGMTRTTKIVLSVLAAWFTIGLGTALFQALSAPKAQPVNLDAVTATRLVSLGDQGLVQAAYVTPQFFASSTFHPQAGRFLLPNASGPPTAVISDRLWRERYHADPVMLGSQVTIEGRPTYIVGVIPAGFHHPVGVDVWISAERGTTAPPP